MMDQREQILSIATAVLQEKQEPQTGESLANAVGKKFGRPVLPGQLAKLLQSRPQVFLLDGGGRWQLRPQQNVLLLEDETNSINTSTSPVTGTTRSLKCGCYVIFDLEATRQDALSPYTEIIQIAAERWLDGVLDERWESFVHPEKAVQERIHQLTHITPAELEHAPQIQQVLPEFLDFVGDLPLIAHNGASYDGPLIQATCQCLQIPLPATFLVLDTLPLARTLLPTEEAHRVGTLAERFGYDTKNAHRADADVAMLSGIIQNLQQIILTEKSGQAVYEFFRRANDPWAQLLTPPTSAITPSEIIATLGAQVTPLLSELSTVSTGSVDSTAVEQAYTRAEAERRTRRPLQEPMSHLAADTLQRP